MAVDCRHIDQFFGLQAALAQSFHEDHLALMGAVVVLLLGICFIPPLGGGHRVDVCCFQFAAVVSHSPS